jgi:hypothetical protein
VLKLLGGKMETEKMLKFLKRLWAGYRELLRRRSYAEDDIQPGDW